ncbi:hypothetical protein [Marinovum algicola]|uniref:hypothetical protein n=1 Tax=Marinovum algicola TaxID=42444 RepID=UPI003B52F788
MSDMIRELKAMAAQDLANARYLGNAVDALEYCMSELTRAGFVPQLSDERGLVALRVDLSARTSDKVSPVVFIAADGALVSSEEFMRQWIASGSSA